ncbi:hypothetical protein HaLaN_07289, partial [Haematococcus lacustris]
YVVLGISGSGTQPPMRPHTRHLQAAMVPVSPLRRTFSPGSSKPVDFCKFDGVIERGSIAIEGADRWAETGDSIGSLLTPGGVYHPLGVVRTQQAICVSPKLHEGFAKEARRKQKNCDTSQKQIAANSVATSKPGVASQQPHTQKKLLKGHSDVSDVAMQL